MLLNCEFKTAITLLRCGECKGIRRKAWAEELLWTEIGFIIEVFPTLNTADLVAKDWQVLDVKQEVLDDCYYIRHINI